MKFHAFNKMVRWLHEYWVAAALSIVVVSSAVGIVVYTHNPGVSGTERINRDTSTQKEKPLRQPLPLTGIEAKPKEVKQPVTGVMIENSPSARPHTGLDSADIVFEAVVEGGITRFLALYQSNTPRKLGPVRSLRPYFLDWVMGFDAPIAHVGGSAQALELVKKRGAKDLDQFKHNGPYYRDGGRPAPHNMYSSMNNLRKLQKRLGYRKSRFKKIPRSDDDPANKPGAKRITVNYSDSQYQAQFRYQKNGNKYRRFLAGNPHIDTLTSSPITVKNVVVIRMPTTKQGRYAVMETIGSGKAIVFKNGTAQKAKWRQQSPRKRIEILKNRKQMPLNRGDTWFAILPSGQSVNY